MSDLRNTLEHILHLCNQSRTYSRRTQLIHEAAMKGLGLTVNQRHQRHMAIFERIGDNPAMQAYQAREAKRQAKEAARTAQEVQA